MTVRTYPQTYHGRGVRRVEFIEMQRTTVREVAADGNFVGRGGASSRAWGEPAVEGDLWEFECGTQLAVGAASVLDSDPPVVSRRLAADLIRAGDAVAASVRSLDESDLELRRVDAEEAA